MTTLWDSCNDSCGLTAAALAALAYGSYGVPIKSCRNIDVDPLVLESYKITVFFLFCWCVTPLLGEEVVFTYWGIVSGLLVVPGNTCGVYAIRSCGMSTAIGVWASVIVYMNAFWGFLVFHERVQNIAHTVMAFALLICGLIGMSLCSSKESSETEDPVRTEKSVSPKNIIHFPIEYTTVRKRNLDVDQDSAPNSTGAPLEIESLLELGLSEDGEVDKTRTPKNHLLLPGGRFALTKRQVGILMAAFNGVCCGSSLVPMHYADRDGFSKAGFLFSYGCGSFLVAIAVWVLIFFIRLIQKQASFSKAIAALPSWHIRQLWLPGLLSGLLASVGLVGSMIAVSGLGIGIGNSLVQTKILVSGVWGICYYKEISGRRRILNWFVAATLTVTAILWVTYERQGSMKAAIVLKK